jgi:hypothetical protein
MFELAVFFAIIISRWSCTLTTARVLGAAFVLELRTLMLWCRPWLLRFHACQALVLTDPSGRVVKTVRNQKDEPQFPFRANLTGEYTLTIELADASAGRAQVGVVVLAR